MRALCAAFLCALMLVQTVSAMPEREILVYTEPQDGVQSIDEDGAEGEDGAEAEKEVDASDGTGVQGETGVELNAPSAILMEKETGQIVFEKNPDEQLAPASVTKIMTLLLIFDAIADGKLGSGISRSGRSTDGGYHDQVYCSSQRQRCLCGYGGTCLRQRGGICRPHE